ncbi:MAG: phage tail tape measure protein, partial [Novosphingobium sp.]|nr:phage tail tape measure protein [Novosphingobium sp.]
MAIDRALSLMVKFAALDRLTKPMRTIGGASARASRDIAGTRKEILALNQAQAKIKGLQDLKRGLDQNHASLDKARRRVRELRLEFENTANPTKKLSNALAAAQRQAAKLEETGGQLSARLIRVRTEIAGAGIDVANLARHEQRLANSLRDANQRLAQQRAELERVAKARQKMQATQELGGKMQGAGAASAAAGVAIGAPILASSASWKEYQSALTDIGQKSGMVRSRTEAMGRELDTIGSKVGQLPAELAKGMDALTGLGLGPKLAMAMMTPIAKTATAYRAEMNDISRVTFANFDNLKVPIGQTTKALDIMANAGKAGGFELRDMAKQFPMLTASAAALGQSGVGAVADLSAALEVAFKGTGDADAAANNIQNLLSKINANATIKSFKELGVDLPNAMKRAAADGKTPLEAIAEITNRALNGDLSKLPQLFEDMQVQGALRPLIQNLALYRKLRSDALAANGEVERDFAEKMRDSAVADAAFNAKMQAMAHRIGAIVTPQIDAVKASLGALADRMGAWANANPALFKTLVTVAAALAAILFVGGTLVLMLGTILGPFALLRFGLLQGLHAMRMFGTALLWLIKIFPLMRTAMMILARGIFQAGMMMLANPVVAAIVAIVAAVGLAAYLIWKHWATIKAAFSSALAFLGRMWSSFKSFGGNLIQGLIDGVTGKLGALKRTILSVGSSAVGWFKNLLGIHSPSRVFMALGGHLTNGLALGVDRGGDRPVERMKSVAARVAAAMAVGAAAPAAAGAGSP